MKKFLQILTLILAVNANAQMPSIEWIRSSNEYDATPPQGSFTYNATDVAGNLYTFGKFSDTKDFDASNAVYNLTAGNATCSNYITKYDANGNFIWAKTFGSTSINGLDRPQAISVDTSGNIYVTGAFTDTGDFDPGIGVATLTGYSFSGYNTLYVLKLTTNGDFVWARTVGAIHSIGYSIAVDHDFNVVVGAQLSLNIPSVIKFDTTGTLLWKMDFPVEFYFNAYVSDIAIDGNNNIVAAGTFMGTIDFDPTNNVQNATSAGSKDFFIIKLNTNGNLLFGKRIGGISEDLSQSIIVDSNNNIYVNGTFTTITDFDPNAGIFNLTPSVNYYADTFLLKLDNMGEFLWAKKVATTTNIDYPFDMQIGTNNDIYTIGVFQEYLDSPVDFDPGAGVYNLNSGITANCYFLKLTQNGDFVWAFTGSSLGVNRNDFRSLAIDIMGSLFVARTGYLVKINQPLLSRQEFLKSDLKLYPNPASSNINFSFDDIIQNANLKIISLFGQTVLEQQNISGDTTALDVSALSAGVYLVEVVSENKKFTSKFIKQ